MKYLLLTSILYLITIKSFTQKNDASFIGIVKPQNAFNKNLKVLGNAINGTYDITIDSAIRYMERVTHIKAHGDCQYVLIYFTCYDLAFWKTWYDNIGSKRFSQNF